MLELPLDRPLLAPLPTKPAHPSPKPDPLPVAGVEPVLTKGHPPAAPASAAAVHPVRRWLPALPARPALSLRDTASLMFTALRWTIAAFAVWLLAMVALVGLFRYVDPPLSMLMLTQRLGGRQLQHDWIALDQVSNNLRRAVVTSEDGKFCRHWGFDLGEIRAAMKAGDRFGRGASTISQQVAKNLFLWPGKSYVRKGLEVPLTVAIEGLWPKWRIFEVYINIAEWGPGVFGAEAAAQYYFNKPAANLTEREAALLAVSLPNPIARDASDPQPALARRAQTLQSRMRAGGVSACLLGPRSSTRTGSR